MRAVIIVDVFRVTSSCDQHTPAVQLSKDAPALGTRNYQNEGTLSMWVTIVEHFGKTFCHEQSRFENILDNKPVAFGLSQNSIGAV